MSATRGPFMMQTDFIVALDDIRYVEIHCSNCTTKVTLDMEKNLQTSAKNRTLSLLRKVPVVEKTTTPQ
jgi:hypothetical protein